DVDPMIDWLGGLRGSRVRLRVPKRGEKRQLADTVARNAEEAFTQHKLKRAGDLTARSAALSELQGYLDLDTAPLRIECVDISHISGTDVVASLVVFEDGVPRKSEYRRGALREAAQQWAGAAIAEVVRRRFARYLKESGGNRTPDDEQAAAGAQTGQTAQAGQAEQDAAGDGGTAAAPGSEGEGTPPGIDPETGKPRKFAYPPNLLVVDGAGAQATAASDVLAELGITDVAVVGLAKRLEEVWLPADAEPVILPRTSEALYMLQRVRDEAHRFAVRYHRKQRSKRVQSSALDGIPGLGQTRRNALIKHFGSVKKLKKASVEEIAEAPGVGRRTAEAVRAALVEAPNGAGSNGSGNS